MASIIGNITFAILFERIKRRLANNYGSIFDNISNNEISLYLYEALAVAITQQSNAGLGIDGIRAIPEGFLTTYSFSSFNKDYDRGIWTISLPQPPVNLPLGYSIVSPYFSKNGSTSIPLIAINPYQRGYASKLGKPNYGVYYWVENNIMFLDGDGRDITQLGKLYVPMQSPRSETGDDNDTISLPDDQMSFVFDLVINKLTLRQQVTHQPEITGKPEPHTT